MPAAARSCPSCRSLSFLAALTLLAGAAAAPAAAPRDELLRYVPDDVGFCFVLQDFRDQLKTLAASPFAEQLDKSPLVKAFVGGAEIQQLLDLDKQVKLLTSLTSDELRDDIFGDAVVFAFRPAPPGKPDQEQGVVLLRARKADKLQKLIDHINDAQKKSGQLTQLDEREYHGFKYFCRTEKKETNYYYVRGSVFVFTGQEAILKDALDHDRALAADAEPVLVRRFRDAGLPRSLFTVWINPRAFDDLLAARTKEATAESDVAFLKQFAAYWKALDGVFVAVGADKELSLTLALQGRTDALPAAAQKLLAGAAKPSELKAIWPDNALLATAARLDLPALLDVLGDFMTKENREVFRQQVSFTGLLPKNYLQGVGPDLGLVVTAPASDEKTWVPHAAFALRVTPGADPTRPTDEAIVSALTAFAHVTAYAYSQQHPNETVELTKSQQGKRDVHTLVGDKAFPPGVQPSLTLAGGYLLLADSPATIQQFADALANRGKAPDETAFPLLRLSLKDWRAYLKDRRTLLAQAMIERDIPKKDAGERLDNLLGVLQFADRLEVSQRTAAGRTTLTIAVQPAYPLKK